MGKIEGMQNKYNEANNKKLRKEPLDIGKKGIKGFAILFGPEAKKYRLTENQKKFQKGGRFTIATLATALTIGGSASFVNTINPHSSKQNTETTIDLESDTVSKDAENLLKSYIFGEKLDTVENPIVKYIFDKDDGNSALLVTSGKGDNTKIEYQYSKNLSFDSILNDKKIVELIDSMIEINLSQPTQEELQELSEIVENLKDENFKLKGGHIVSANEKETDFER